MRKICAVIFFMLVSVAMAQAQAPVILVLGDSLTAGLGLPAPQAFPAQLQGALQAKWPGAQVLNAGVSGDTAADGQARLDWAMRDDVTGVIVELGANDALRGLNPDQTEKALDQILASLVAKKIPVLLAGMRAPPNMGADYAAKFDAIYPRLAQKYPVIYYAFFLDGVAAQPQLNQGDGMHPNEAGVKIIVNKILPDVERLINQSPAP